MMKKRVLRAAWAASVAAALAVLSGCGGDASRDPQVMQRFQAIETKLAEVRNLPLKVEDLNDEFKNLEGRVGILEKDPARAGSQAIVKKLGELEAKLNALNTRISSLETKLAQRPAAASPKPAVTLKTSPPAKAPGPKPKSPVAPAPKTAKKPPEPTKPPAPKPKGAYHRAEPGDTLEGFAKRHNVSIEALVQANPRTLKALRGQDKLPIQSYWVPGK